MAPAPKLTHDKICSQLDESRAVTDGLPEPNLGAMRDFLYLAESCMDLIPSFKFLPEERIALLREQVLHSLYPAVELFRKGQREEAKEWMWQVIWAHAQAAAAQPDAEALQIFRLALEERLVSQRAQRDARNLLRRLMTHLKLGQDDLGRMFGVSGETVRRWERAKVEIPQSRQADLVITDAALHRLIELFVPERLPQVVRRKVDLFGGERALDWILQGRISEVADRYEMALAYQA